MQLLLSIILLLTLILWAHYRISKLEKELKNRL